MPLQRRQELNNIKENAFKLLHRYIYIFFAVSYGQYPMKKYILCNLRQFFFCIVLSVYIHHINKKDSEKILKITILISKYKLDHSFLR